MRINNWKTTSIYKKNDDNDNGTNKKERQMIEPKRDKN